MKRISTQEIMLSILSIAWVVALDMNSLTMIQKVGLGSVSVYLILLALKVVKRSKTK